MRINIANLEIKQRTIHQQKKERAVIALNCLMTACQKNLDRFEKRAMQLCPEYDADHHAWKKVVQYEDEAERLQGELMSCASYSPPPKRTKINDSPNQNEKEKQISSKKSPPVKIIAIDVTNKSLNSDMQSNEVV